MGGTSEDTDVKSCVIIWMQRRYAAGVKEMLEQFFTGQPFDEDNYIVKEGELSSQYKWILCKQQQWIKVSMQFCHNRNKPLV